MELPRNTKLVVLEVDPNYKPANKLPFDERHIVVAVAAAGYNDAGEPAMIVADADGQLSQKSLPSFYQYLGEVPLQPFQETETELVQKLAAMLPKR